MTSSFVLSYSSLSTAFAIITASSSSSRKIKTSITSKIDEVMRTKSVEALRGANERYGKSLAFLGGVPTNLSNSGTTVADIAEYVASVHDRIGESPAVIFITREMTRAGFQEYRFTLVFADDINCIVTLEEVEQEISDRSRFFAAIDRLNKALQRETKGKYSLTTEQT